MISEYQAKLYARELLLRRPADSGEKLTPVLMGAKVDLNPHQVDAALFAFRSPLSKGAILADEVGLGKTVEAAIVLAQLWAERKRAVLILAPASLRAQWRQELWEKFFLPSVIMDRKTADNLRRGGLNNPFKSDSIVIVSYDFAYRNSQILHEISWDIVVMDEAHRLRNAYRKSNRMARELRAALEGSPKLLLTATPLQNSIQELYSLVSFIDEHTFSDPRTFREHYAVPDEKAFRDLRRRLAPLCKRTLRRQVTEYIKFTERRALTQDFTLSNEEQALYDRFSEFLRQEKLWCLPSGRRPLMILVLRKLLASSSFAVEGALRTMLARLEYILYHYREYRAGEKAPAARLAPLLDDVEILSDEDPPLWGIEGETIHPKEDEESIREEINSLRAMLLRARMIRRNAKGDALLAALKTAFAMTAELGAEPRAVIFTESRRTQSYLFKLLSAGGYRGRIVLFNGSNDDPDCSGILARWRERHAGDDCLTGSRDTDMRSALVEAFREDRPIMIATEAAAEGINLQFCSLVINYDLPWNPQRIEQCIGRCHRYGQKHDVVVVNFLNRSNEADKRVFELLSEKFRLFSGVFGTSDDILGGIDSGADFEKRIADIYQSCRTPEEIQASFDALQASLSGEISSGLRGARQKLLENFDTEVTEKLRVYGRECAASLSRHEAMFWDVTRRELADLARFDPTEPLFILEKSPAPDTPAGVWSMNGEGHAWRPRHPFALRMLEGAAARRLPSALLHIHPEERRIAILAPFSRQSGWALARTLSLSALEREDHLLCAAVTDSGLRLDSEQARRIFDLPHDVASHESPVPPEKLLSLLHDALKTDEERIREELTRRNGNLFDDEMEKLDRWAEDRRTLLELRLKEMERAIGEARAEARRHVDLQEKLRARRAVTALEHRRNEMRRNLFDEQDAVDAQKERLLDGLEKNMTQKLEKEDLFLVRWVMTA